MPYPTSPSRSSHCGWWPGVNRSCRTRRAIGTRENPHRTGPERSVTSVWHGWSPEPAWRPAISPDLERARLYQAVVELLSWASRRRPVAVLIEDIHIADPPSLELAGKLLRLFEQRFGLHRGCDAGEHDPDAAGELFQEGCL